MEGRIRTGFAGYCLGQHQCSIVIKQHLCPAYSCRGDGRAFCPECECECISTYTTECDGLCQCFDLACRPDNLYRGYAFFFGGCILAIGGNESGALDPTGGDLGCASIGVDAAILCALQNLRDINPGATQRDGSGSDITRDGDGTALDARRGGCESHTKSARACRGDRTGAVVAARAARVPDSMLERDAGRGPEIGRPAELT